MAHSVENRVPFLTPRLVEFVQRVPESFLIGDDCLTKSVFRRAMRGIVPDAVLDRRDKIGFTPPPPPPPGEVAGRPRFLGARDPLAGIGQPYPVPARYRDTPPLGGCRHRTGTLRLDPVAMAERDRLGQPLRH